MHPDPDPVYATVELAMLPRPKSGPFQRSVREALESVQAAESAQALLDEALEAAGLPAVPEEIQAFRRFCERHLSRILRTRLEDASVDQVFERIGHVLWMATSDASQVEVARVWGRGETEWEDDSGVRHLDSQGRPTPKAPTPEAGVYPPRIPPSAPLPTPSNAISIGKMKAVAASSPTGSRPRVTQELRAQAPDDRAGSSPPPAIDERPATAVLAITLDGSLVESMRAELASLCPVRAISSPTEIASAVLTSGPCPVVLIDTGLPSIDLPTFAGIAPVLPQGARVVLWGISPRQLHALVAKFPIASGWLAPEGHVSPGEYLVQLR
jgi:hypothetical protein